MAFINRERVDVPEELAPLTGYVDVYKIVPADAYQDYWAEYQKMQKRLKNKKSDFRNWHNMFQVFNARMNFVIEAHFYLPDDEAKGGRQEIALPDYMKRPRDLPFPSIASFVFHATQEAFAKANFFPRLRKPSTTTTNTNQVDRAAVKEAKEAATEEE